MRTMRRRVLKVRVHAAVDYLSSGMKKVFAGRKKDLDVRVLSKNNLLLYGMYFWGTVRVERQ